jgi:hypothetical protein
LPADSHYCFLFDVIKIDLKIQLKRIKKGIKNLEGKLLIFPALISGFYFGGCDHTITGKITVQKENVGEIVGRVLYDPYGEGYMGAKGVTIVRRGPDNSNLPEGYFGERTVSMTGGAYSYQDVPVGTHELKIIPYPSHDELWFGRTGVSVTKGSVVEADIVLYKFEYPE